MAVLELMPEKYRQWLFKYQNFAGWRSNIASGSFAASKVYLAVLTAALAVWLPLPAVLAFMALTFFLPDLVLFLCARNRQKQIRQSLPQALDLMVLCVDAGLGLDATLQRIAMEKTAVSTALNEELLILSRDILLGMERERAYQELYNRSGVEELRSLGSSLNQAGKMGLSIAKALRNQSEFLCNKLSMRAEESAAKLPIYMAFPLWFCIMPALLVIVLAPSLITFFQQAGFGLFK